MPKSRGIHGERSMTKGYGVLMKLDGKAVKTKTPPRFDRMVRIQARSGWMVSEDAFTTHLRSA